MDKQYEKIGKNYNSLIKTDPLKNYIQYPAILKLVGNRKDRKILDMGCGNGILSREIAKKDNFVVGFDIATKQIKDAKAFKSENIVYKVADQKSFKWNSLFDEAICIMVMNYANDKNELMEFFNCAYKHLKNGGKFIFLIFLVKDKDFNKIVFNRRFSKSGINKVKVEFFDKNSSFSAIVSNFSLQEYKACARKIGFKSIKIIVPKITKEGLKNYPKEFWKGYLNTKPYKILTMVK